MSPTVTMTAVRADTTTARPETSATAVGRELAGPVTVLAMPAGGKHNTPGTAMTLVEAFAVAGARCGTR